MLESDIVIKSIICLIFTNYFLHSLLLFLIFTVIQVIILIRSQSCRVQNTWPILSMPFCKRDGLDDFGNFLTRPGHCILSQTSRWVHRSSCGIRHIFQALQISMLSWKTSSICWGHPEQLWYRWSQFCMFWSQALT